jgi:hypothetical protein
MATRGVPVSLDVAIALVQRGQQFQDHALERGQIIGQLLGGSGWQASNSGVRGAHADKDVFQTVVVPRRARKKGAAGAARLLNPFKLGGAKSHARLAVGRGRPVGNTLFESLIYDDVAVLVPVQQLDSVAALVPEDEDVPGQRVMVQMLPHLRTGPGAWLRSQTG